MDWERIISAAVLLFVVTPILGLHIFNVIWDFFVFPEWVKKQ